MLLTTQAGKQEDTNSLAPQKTSSRGGLCRTIVAIFIRLRSGSGGTETVEPTGIGVSGIGMRVGRVTQGGSAAKTSNRPKDSVLCPTTRDRVLGS